MFLDRIIYAEFFIAVSLDQFQMSCIGLGWSHTSDDHSKNTVRVSADQTEKLPISYNLRPNHER